MFHVSLLRNHKPRAGEDTPEPEPLHLAEDPAEKEWEVEAITASQIVDGPEGKPVLQYQIVWKESSEITWEPADNVRNSKRLVKKFHDDFPEAPQAVTNAGTRLRGKRARSLALLPTGAQGCRRTEKMSTLQSVRLTKLK